MKTSMLTFTYALDDAARVRYVNGCYVPQLIQMQRSRHQTTAKTVQVKADAD